MNPQHPNFQLRNMSSRLHIMQSLHLGQLLLIETNKELLMGTLVCVDGKNHMIELDNVRDIKSGFVYQSSQTLTYDQMVSIKLVDGNNTTSFTETSSTDTDADESLEDSKSSSSISASKPTKQQNSIDSSKESCDSLSVQLSALDLQLLQSQLDSLVYIVQTDQKYHKAIEDIRSQTVVGLFVDPLEAARYRQTSLIAISTPKAVYIFDILNLGKIFSEFRIILESQRPRKAVHYSHRIVDHFKHRHDLQLAGVFDTFVAYCIVTNEKRHKSLIETVETVFNISALYFDPELETNCSPNPYMRPIPQDYRLAIAKKVAFQLKLYDHLLHEQMLKNFYQQCQNFCQTLAPKEDGFEVAQLLYTDSHAGYEHIQPHGNWKDKLETDTLITKFK